VKGSFSELDARERAAALLDAGTFRELLDPFQGIESPHLPPQGIVPQSDDGVVVARGRIDGVEAVALAIEGNYQGGSIGEVNGAKIAGALELALRDARRGRIVRPLLLLDTGGIRLQEANLGILAISEMHAAIVALREWVPVVGVIAGRIGCFGGMGIAAGLCSVLIGSEIGRLGLNGPEVIEQEAGIAELDARDRPRVWATIGCRRRRDTGDIDVLVEDDVSEISAAVHAAFRERPATPRSTALAAARERIAKYTLPPASGDAP
jgi:malonate decarboxylase beta subunit